MTARAGYCTECGQESWLRPKGGCIRGHDPRSILHFREVPLPPEVDRFNWGAFFFPLLWPLVNGPARWAGILLAGYLGLALVYQLSPETPVTLILLLIMLAAVVWFGRSANRLLWDAAPWAAEPQRLLKNQRIWGVAGLVIHGSVALLMVLVFVRASTM